jgi:integral membrane sensor domain MASE1
MLSLWFYAGVGTVLGGLASAMAYIIFYQEYIHHLRHERARKVALQGALTAFVFFVLFAVAAGFVLSYFILPSQ